PARVSARVPPASSGHGGCRSLRPSQSCVLPGGPTERRNFPAPPPEPCRGWPPPPLEWGGTADWRGAFPDSYWESRPWRHPAGPPPCPTCGWPLAAPAWLGPPRKTAIGRMDGPLPPRPPDKPCAVFGVASFPIFVHGATP